MADSNEKISEALSRLFDRHRIVFWYDTKSELRSDFESLSLDEIEKIELQNNEYGVKHRMLRESPEQKFLVYKAGERPNDLENWLLDVELSHGDFRTDQGSLWLAELGLGHNFLSIIEEHAEFFQALKRREALKTRLRPDDTSGAIRLKMIAVCCGSDPRMDNVVEHLLAELQPDSESSSGDKFRLLDRFNLSSYFWEQLKRHYGYESPTPTIRDFVIQLFKDCYLQQFPSKVSQQSHLSSDALVFLKRWKDSRQFERSFESLSNDCASALSIERDLIERDFRDLIDVDFFRLIDQKIISELVQAITSRTVTTGDVTLWVRQRRQTHWYNEFRHIYEALDYGSQFIGALTEAQLGMDSIEDGLFRYSRTWFRLDQLYRKFTYHARASSQASLLGVLKELIENLYSNNYLLALNDRWQSIVDSLEKWQSLGIPLQRTFFEKRVRPFLNKDNKVCVIISDAMRYEIGDELVSLIRQEDRYSAELEPFLSMVPSYTQLGMAALLPNRELTIADNASGTVSVDGQSSMGTANREKILNDATNGKAAALTSEDFMVMNRDQSREILKATDVLYLYHNRIDHTGDKLQSENQVFEAAEQTLDDLIKLIKKLTATNATNILITADHGFIYQDNPIDESDFSSVDATGTEVLYRNRRFVIGKALTASPGLRSFSSSALGLTGHLEIQIPKSINRLRLQGSGSRFVHGGATLQEVVIPVIKINKKRQSDLSQVDVTILQGSNRLITSSQLAVAFYQEQPTTEKMQSRSLRAGLFSEAGDLISESHNLVFDLTSENPRERELQVRFLLTRKADESNGKDVILRLEERLAGTTHFVEYRSLRYTLRRSFTSDFDF